MRAFHRDGNQALTSLNLSRNDLGLDGIDAIIRNLERSLTYHHTALHSLNLACTSVPKNIMGRLSTALSNNSLTLRGLTLTEVSI